ncbi:ATP-binding protein [Actinomadura monticuli]|uniref:ATP-binding protein n=1 Tax=Actinomadura monticuli TaxID=3097367 RepID=A0ABV4Q5U4_9ACTN
MLAALLTPEAPPLVLEPSDRAPSLARRYLAERYRELGIADDYVGQVVVSELVTNSWQHVGTGYIVVQVRPDKRDDLVLIEVWDVGAGRPVVRGEDDDAESGRGLLLMEQLVHDWGVRPLNEEGKVVWARCTR